MAELYEAGLLRAAALEAAGPRRTGQAGQEESLHPLSDFHMDMELSRNHYPCFGDVHSDIYFQYRYGGSVD